MQPSINGRLLTLWIIVPAAIAWPCVTAGRSQSTGPVEVRAGTVTFDVGTNMLSLNVHGTSDALQASARVREEADGLVVEHMEAAVPIDSLTTGLRLRDEHMRKYVFTTPAGDAPELRFSSGTATCAPVRPGEPSTCHVSGELEVRGTPRPFAVALKIARKGGGFRVSGDGMVKLSEYGIDAPSQLGVRTEDQVNVHFEFTAKPGSRLTTSSRDAR
jgi:polyisoprenoid-binding protein YceI